MACINLGSIGITANTTTANTLLRSELDNIGMAVNPAVTTEEIQPLQRVDVRIAEVGGVTAMRVSIGTRAGATAGMYGYSRLPPFSLPRLGHFTRGERACASLKFGLGQFLFGSA